MEIQEILDAFKVCDGKYKREAVDEAVKRKDEITPHLINILENFIADPQPYIDDEYRFDYIYATVLLQHFGEVKAHDLFIRILNMPYDILDGTFSDGVDLLAGALFKTCGGSLDKIKSLILNKDADDDCRNYAMEAMVWAYADGMISREEIVDFFGSLFTGAESNEDEMFWSFLAYFVCEIYPEELMPVIKKAYEDELIDEFYISLEDFEKSLLKDDKETVLNNIKEEMQIRMPSDIHDYLQNWALFSYYHEEQERVKRKLEEFLRKKEAKKKKAKKQKNKKKMAKSSRKKNRKK